MWRHFSAELEELVRGFADSGVWTLRSLPKMWRSARGVSAVTQSLSKSQVRLEVIRRMLDGFSQVIFGLRLVALSIKGYGIGQMGVRE